MGCDIHWNSETRKDGQWVCDQEIKESEWDEGEMRLEDMPGRDRDYWLFGLLAEGVRTTWDWSFPYKNALPDDLSAEVSKRYETEGDHSPSSLTRADLLAKHEELKLIRAEYLIAPPEGDIKHYSEAVAHQMKRLEEIIGYLTADVPADDQRIVFWFDS